MIVVQEIVLLFGIGNHLLQIFRKFCYLKQVLVLITGIDEELRNLALRNYPQVYSFYLQFHNFPVELNRKGR